MPRLAFEFALKNLLDRRRGALDAVLLCLGPLALAALAASFAWDVEAMGTGTPWRLVGWEPHACPGCAACGLSRAFAAASHGRWNDALRFNAGVLALYPAAWLVTLTGGFAALRLLVARRA